MLPCEVKTDGEAAALAIGELTRFVDDVEAALSEDLGEAPPRSVTRALVNARAAADHLRKARLRNLRG